MANSSTLWPIFFLSMFLAWMTDIMSQYTRGDLDEKVYVRKNKLFFVLLVVAMCIFVGLRSWCNDTTTYRYIYEYLTKDSGPLMAGIGWKLGDSPGFALVNTIIKRIGFSSQDFLMLYAFITNILYLWFLRKYSSDFWLSVFLFFTMGIYMFTAAGIRQAVAIAISLLGIDRALQKKWVPFVFWVLIASLFHPYALLFLAVPFLMFAPWTGRTWLMLLLFGVIGVNLQGLLGTIVDITTMLGREYDETSFAGEGVNTFRLLVVWAPVALSFLAQRLMRQSEERENNLFMNLSMLNAEIMFVALFGTANYFARLANYFLFFQALALPWMLRFFTRGSRRMLKVVIIVCYMAYFVAANVILTPFNTYFAKMSLGEYLRSVFL